MWSKKKREKSTKKNLRKKGNALEGEFGVDFVVVCFTHTVTVTAVCLFTTFFSLTLSLSLHKSTCLRGWKNLRSITIIKILFFTHLRHITAAAGKGEWEADDLWLLFGDECIWECYKHKKNCFLRLTFVWHWNSLLPYHFSAVLQRCRH